MIIDCTPVGNENKEKLYNKYANNGRGFIAQGSEDGFGKKYARGINDKALVKGEDQFIQVVSCNTHNLAVLIDTIALGPEKEDNLAESRFVCMRRANDLSQEGDFIPAPEASKHDDPQFGTHQGRDAHYLFKTLGLELDVYSSALKLNTQYMHTIHFDLKLRRGITMDELMRRLKANLRVALTNKKSSASVFSFGRDHGMFGRILNQTVIVSQSLAMRGDKEIVGTCFTPAGRQLAFKQYRRVAYGLCIRILTKRGSRRCGPISSARSKSNLEYVPRDPERAPLGPFFIRAHLGPGSMLKTDSVAGLDTVAFRQAAVDFQHILAGSVNASAGRGKMASVSATMPTIFHIAVDKNHVQRYRRVFHPEGLRRLPGNKKIMPRSRSQISTILKTHALVLPANPRSQPGKPHPPLPGRNRHFGSARQALAPCSNATPKAKK